MGVEFNEPAATASSRPPVRQSFFIRSIIKTGVVKTEQGAQVVLIILAVVLIGLAVYLFRHTNVAPPVPTADQIGL